MPKFGTMLYLVSNLALCIASTKFNVKFDIALENAFYVRIPNFDIGTQIWHCIGDALIILTFGFCPLEFYFSLWQCWIGKK